MLIACIFYGLASWFQIIVVAAYVIVVKGIVAFVVYIAHKKQSLRKSKLRKTKPITICNLNPCL